MLHVWNNSIVTVTCQSSPMHIIISTCGKTDASGISNRWIQMQFMLSYVSFLYNVRYFRYCNPPPLYPPLGLIWTMTLVWSKGNINRTVSVLQYCVAFQQCILHNHEQFFQVGVLNRSLISLGLALSPPSTSVSSDFMVLCKCFFLITLHFPL